MKTKIAFIISIALLAPILALASTGTIDSFNKYAWGNNIGWVNFNPTNGNVQVTDTALTGYAWSENYGWINLNPSQSGVKNSGGVLSGSAWGEGTGYINFSGVTINSNGKFTGTATGSTVGTLTFGCTNCNVTTTWRLSNSPAGGGGLNTGGGSSGGGGGSVTPPPTPTLSSSTTPTSILGCGNRTTGFSIVSGGSCVGNVPTTPLNSFTGCTSNVGFSISTGLSCAGNPGTASSGQSVSTGSTAPSGSATYDFGTVTLKVGSTGFNVQELQRFLNDTMHLGLVLDGKLGPKTIAVMIKWQIAHNLIPDGLIGPKTKAAMLASVK